MANLSVKEVTSGCLDRQPRSVLRDVFGIYGSNSQGARRRSVRQQLERIRNRPFVRVACVTVRPQNSTAGQYANQQRDLDNANDTYLQRCGSWVYCSGSRVATTGILGTNGVLDQRDCNAGWLLDFIGIGDHEVSREERDLFRLGRDLGADVVCYFLSGATSGLAGCAAHPDGRRGFWVSRSGSSQWTFAHELGHVVGNLGHVGSRSNLMSTPTSRINANPPGLSSFQCEGVRTPEFPDGIGGVIHDRDVERC